jgi:hypothetical protein
MSVTEAAIFRIEQNGPVTCSTPANSDFVLVDVPLRVMGDCPRDEALYRYRIGAFVGRVVPWTLEEDQEIVARLRIPREKFRTGEELLFEVLTKDRETVLLSSRWEAAWYGDTPGIAPGRSDHDSTKESERRPRYYRSGH